MEKVLALSAGHYKYTSGKRCLKALDPNETREWVLNSRVAEKLTAILNQYEGIKIVRLDDPTGEKAVDLQTRAKTSNSAKADFYLAIHHNAGINGGSGGGIVVYHYPTNKDKSNATILYNKLIERTALKGNRSNPIVATTNLYEVAAPVAPSILVENGFMDSKTDVPIILSESHADKSAQAMAEFFVEMWGLKKKSAPVATPTVDFSKEIAQIRNEVSAISEKLNELERAMKWQNG